MHPFGGTPVCPRCGKLVYAAEQVMGPGRKLYHKPCLACTNCNRRLDSLILVEHNQLPYCKSCHSKQFGTRDLRQANLPHIPDLPASLRPASTILITTSTTAPPLPPRSPSPIRATVSNPPATGNGKALPTVLRPTHSLGPNNTLGSPTKRIFQRFDAAIGNPHTGESDPDVSEVDTIGIERLNMNGKSISAEGDTIGDFKKNGEHLVAKDDDDSLSHITRTYSPGPTNTGRPGYGGIPRTVPLSPTRTVPPSYVGSALSEEPDSFFSDGITTNIPEQDEDEDSEDPKPEPTTPISASPISSPTVSPLASGTRTGTRTLPLHSRYEALNLLRNNNVSHHSTGSSVGSNVAGTRSRPMSVMTTGTRYGAVLAGALNGGGNVGMDFTGSSTYSSVSASSTGSGESPRRWGSAVTPTCPRCGTKVYFAEQVKAIGKTWHKSCLRCTQCGTTLGPSKLNDHDDQPFCARCYSRLHGPHGSGYALLGKPGS